MAASRTAPKNVTTSRTASGRLSFARIREPLEVPDLLALQTESFDWLLGNERWQARVAEAKAAGRTDVPDRSGLEEIFEEISPIEDFSGTMSLSFRDHRRESLGTAVHRRSGSPRREPGSVAVSVRRRLAARTPRE